MTSSDWTRIYRENVWNGVESRSGPGSGDVATERVIPTILEVVERYGIASVLDVACGDGYWLPELPGYVGIDASEVAIRLHQERRPLRQLHVSDVRDWTRGADLVILRDVVQHLSLEDSTEVVRASWGLGRFLLASTYVGGENVGLARPQLLQGRAYWPDLEAPPFSLGTPLQLLRDGWSYERPVRVRDERKMLGLWKT